MLLLLPNKTVSLFFLAQVLAFHLSIRTKPFKTYLVDVVKVGLHALNGDIFVGLGGLRL